VHKLIFASAVLLSACTTPSKEQATMSQLQMRQLQVRTIQACDMKTAMTALLNVLQDEGFSVKSVDSNLGVLVAAKEVGTEKVSTKWSSIFTSSEGESKWDKGGIVEAAVMVAKTSDGCQFRVNFQRKAFNKIGRVSDIETLVDESYYQEFFTKVEKALYIENDTI
jgi:hypothetical protein